MAQPQQERAAADQVAPININLAAVNICDTPCRNRGRGVFVKRDLPARHVFIDERPYFTCIRWMHGGNVSDAHAVWKALPHTRRADMIASFPKLDGMKAIIGKDMRWRDKRSLDGFLKSHGFRDTLKDKAHIFAVASHINHACLKCANAEWHLPGEPPQNIRIMAVKPLLKGQEVFIRYNDESKLGDFKCAVCGKSRWAKYRTAIEAHGRRSFESLKKLFRKRRKDDKHDQKTPAKDEDADKKADNMKSSSDTPHPGTPVPLPIQTLDEDQVPRMLENPHKTVSQRMQEVEIGDPPRRERTQGRHAAMDNAPPQSGLGLGSRPSRRRSRLSSSEVTRRWVKGLNVPAEDPAPPVPEVDDEEASDDVVKQVMTAQSAP